MSLINIINESFDRQNKNILAESKLTQLRKALSSKAEVAKNKSLHEYFDYEDAADFDELDDMLEESGSLIHEAAEKLGFKDFEWEDSVQGPYGKSDFWITDDDGNKLHATVDFSETLVTDIDEAVDLLDSLDWKVVGDNIYENIFIKKQKRKSQKLKEDTKKLYKYIVVNHFSPEDFYLIKSNHPVDENMFDAWNFLDVTDKHGKGTVIWNDEYIDFNESGNKSVADLDNEYREGVVRYLSDLEKNGNLDTIKDEYISFDELEYEGYLTDFPAWLDPGDGDGVLEDYMNDKTLKSSYLATMYSDYLENSYVDNDSSSAAVYIDIDDLTQYTDYEEFFGEDEEDEDDF